jgi:ribosomal-protein-alanine N-acetyltransferase
MSLHGTKHLETERLRLRPVSVKDAEILHTEILGNQERLYYLDWNYSADINATKAFVENIISNYQKEFFFFWLIEEKLTRNFIGCVMVCNSDIKGVWQKLNTWRARKRKDTDISRKPSSE